MCRLESVFIYDNAISGTLPVSLGLLSKLEQFRANDNKMFGHIPEEIGTLENLSTSEYVLNVLLLYRSSHRQFAVRHSLATE